MSALPQTVRPSHSFYERGPRKVRDGVYMEPRWTMDGKLLDGPLVQVTELRRRHESIPAARGFNDPWCLSCGEPITGMVHMLETEYLEPQPTGDVVRDYVTGGARYGAVARFCSRCCPRCG